MPQAHCAEALERLGQVTVDGELTQEALEVLGEVALHTEATREKVEVARGGVDCASLLHRLTERGYVQATFVDLGRGRPSGTGSPPRRSRSWATRRWRNCSSSSPLCDRVARSPLYWPASRSARVGA